VSIAAATIARGWLLCVSIAPRSLGSSWEATRLQTAT
jgi:hypothetical protein